jgi:hypothetical protein
MFHGCRVHHHETKILYLQITTRLITTVSPTQLIPPQNYRLIVEPQKHLGMWYVEVNAPPIVKNRLCLILK